MYLIMWFSYDLPCFFKLFQCDGIVAFPIIDDGHLMSFLRVKKISIDDGHLMFFLKVKKIPNHLRILLFLEFFEMMHEQAFSAIIHTLIAAQIAAYTFVIIAEKEK